MTPERKEKAASILRYYAISLFESNTVRGKWDNGTEDLQEEHNEMIDLAAELYLEAEKEKR